MKILIIFILFHIGCLGFIKAQVPLSNFYAYGPNAGDRELPSIDDTSESIPLIFSFPFFGSSYEELHISTNGLITFGSGSSQYTPTPFPILDNRCIASYWTDSDPSLGGHIYYRETSDLDELISIQNEIRSKFVQHRTYRSNWALIVTFFRVPAFGCSWGSINGNCPTNCNNTITHQTILTTNGVKSFAIFNFNELRYTAGSANCQGHAQVGFNAGDGERFALVQMSNSPEIAQVAIQESNVGIAGKWIFSTGESDLGT